jgi:hypothetical protein
MCAGCVGLVRCVEACNTEGIWCECECVVWICRLYILLEWWRELETDVVSLKKGDSVNDSCIGLIL